jgi:hypothetical protein
LSRGYHTIWDNLISEIPLEHPEIMTQGETLEELEENLKDAYRQIVLEDVPEHYEVKEIAL